MTPTLNQYRKGFLLTSERRHRVAYAMFFVGLACGYPVFMYVGFVHSVAFPDLHKALPSAYHVHRARANLEMIDQIEYGDEERKNTCATLLDALKTLPRGRSFLGYGDEFGFQLPFYSLRLWPTEAWFIVQDLVLDAEYIDGFVADISRACYRDTYHYSQWPEDRDRDIAKALKGARQKAAELDDGFQEWVPKAIASLRPMAIISWALITFEILCLLCFGYYSYGWVTITRRLWKEHPERLFAIVGAQYKPTNRDRER